MKFVLKISKRLFNYLPHNWRYILIRSMVNAKESLNQHDVTIQIAKEKEDFETAFKLLHDSYVNSGLMDPHPSGLRCNSYSFLPHTTVIILKKGNDVIGTVSLIRDSAMGLPSDEKYKSENDQLRKESKVLTEVSSLAIDINHRKQGHTYTLLMMKFLYNYSQNCSDTEYLICTIHPRAQDFYRALWGFTRKGKIVSYNYVKGALAVYMNMVVSPENAEKIILSYNSKNPLKNLGLYVLLEDSRFKYPQYTKGQVLEVRMNLEILSYFLKVRTNLFNELSEDHQRMFYEIYNYHFDRASVQAYFPNKEEYFVREFRTPTKIKAIVHFKSKKIESNLLDLSANGCFISFNDVSEIKIQDEIEVSFSLGSNDYLIKGNATWSNSGGNNRYPAGVGVKFQVAVLSLDKELKQWNSTSGKGQSKKSA